MLMRYGFMGVDVFFFISGVVITRSAVGRHPRDFVVARFARLAPAYLLILGATIVVDILVSDPRLTFESALSSLTFSEYVTGTESGGLLILDSWTLWVEIQFYLLIALFFLAGLLLPRKSQRRSFPSLSQLRVVYLVWLALLAMALANVQEIPGLLTLAGYASIFLCGALFGTVVSWRDALRMSPILLLATTMMLFRFLERASGAAIEPTDFGGALATYPLYLMHQELGNRLVIWLQGTGGLATPLALIIAFAVVVALSLFISSRLEPVARRWIVARWRPTPAQPEQESPVSPKG
jgi:peptidoglycan/LPS O-acetylase OafA/YrhL